MNPEFEFETGQPLELAEIIGETLQTMEELFVDLAPQVRELSGKGAELPFVPGWKRLLDGIESFNEGILILKQTLGIAGNPEIQMLEADLTSILIELLEANTRGDYSYQEHLLRVQLIENFDDWMITGIPLLREKLAAKFPPP